MKSQIVKNWLHRPTMQTLHRLKPKQEASQILRMKKYLNAKEFCAKFQNQGKNIQESPLDRKKINKNEKLYENSIKFKFHKDNKRIIKFQWAAKNL